MYDVFTPLFTPVILAGIVMIPVVGIAIYMVTKPPKKKIQIQVSAQVAPPPSAPAPKSPLPFPGAATSVEVKKHKKMGRVTFWLAERTDRRPRASCSYQDAWESYVRWCHEEGYQHVEREVFFRLLEKEVTALPNQKRFEGVALLGDAVH